MSDKKTEPDPLKAAWDQHFAAIKVLRDELEKEGGSIEVNVVVRDKAATEKYNKRRAAAKNRKVTR